MLKIDTESLNRMKVIGTLMSLEVVDGIAKNGKKYKRGNAIIRVNQMYNEREEQNEVKVSFFSTQNTNKGTLNPSYKSICDLEETFIPADKSDMQQASRVAVVGSIRENIFCTKTGRLIEDVSIDGSFFSFPTAHQAEDAANFAVNVFILNITEEVDKEGNETGRLMIRGVVVTYGGKANVLTFYAEGKDRVDFIKENYSVNDTVPFYGNIRSTTVETSRPGKRAAFGSEDPFTTTSLIRELIIIGGEDRYPEDEGYDPLEIKKALEQRKADKEQKVADAEKSKSSSRAAATSGWDD